MLKRGRERDVCLAHLACRGLTMEPVGILGSGAVSYCIDLQSVVQ